MGNQTISSNGGDQISEITESIKIMHESMEFMKHEIVSLKNKRKTENGETSSKRIKLMEAENGASGSEDSDSDDAIASFLADQNEATQGSINESEWAEITDFFEENLETGEEILPDLATLANSVLRAKPKDDKVASLKIKHKRPNNVENLQVTKVDEQLWRQLRRETKTFDYAMQKNQFTLCHALVPTLKLMQNLKEKGPASEARDLAADTFKILAYGINQSNDARREKIKKDLLPSYKPLCNQPSSATKLFGDKLQEEIKHLKETKTNLTSTRQPFLSKKGGGFNNYNQHQRIQSTPAFPPRNNKLAWNTTQHRQLNQPKKGKMGRK
ncbi:uncharacterized protein LOC132722632 [Ruditapes philippinarum]|uniref:uncharacterized protein LOC132722632 n=1 Tax=Ruditapes philippinarum TaxID=129788 RepID=UPI00295A6863|nr:uncharacterized protein LOC132722632 [Ruditapes philippinarum]